MAGRRRRGADVSKGNYDEDALEALMMSEGVVDPATVSPHKRRAARLRNSEFVMEQRAALRELVNQAMK